MLCLSQSFCTRYKGGILLLWRRIEASFDEACWWQICKGFFSDFSFPARDNGREYNGQSLVHLETGLFFRPYSVSSSSTPLGDYTLCIFDVQYSLSGKWGVKVSVFYTNESGTFPQGSEFSPVVCWFLFCMQNFFFIQIGHVLQAPSLWSDILISKIIDLKLALTVAVCYYGSKKWNACKAKYSSLLCTCGPIY